MSMKDAAHAFFDACETGKGWEVCKAWCTEDATFASQTDVLAEVTSLEAYTEWMKGLLTPLPDGRYELKSFAADEDRGNVTAMAVFHGTHTVDAGTGAPTGRSVSSDYCYVMEFSDGRISHMTKVWNDAQAIKQLGWG